MQGARNSRRDRISVTNLDYAMTTSSPHRLTRIVRHETSHPWWVYQPKRLSLRFPTHARAMAFAHKLSLCETADEVEGLVFSLHVEPCS